MRRGGARWGMGCDCELQPETKEQRRVLRTLLAINAAMFLVEVVAGLIADSSGVLADSLDMLADALVYGVSLYAIGRAAVIKRGAARWAGICQLILAASLIGDVARRTVLGSEPESWLMMAVSTVALGANGWCLALLHRHRDGEVHLRASWIFTRSDVIANLGVILAGSLVRLTDSRWPDLVVGAAISLVVIRGGIEILVESRREVQPGA
jgi:Co/Zn/Cd efflux system component